MCCLLHILLGHCLQLVIQCARAADTAAESGCLQQKAADVRRAALQFAPRQATLRQCGGQIIPAGVMRRVGHDHKNIILGADHGGHMLGAASAAAVIALGPPVAHHKAGVTPLPTKNRRDKVIIACRPVAVQRVVGRHDRAGMPLLDSNFKTAQVDFPQSAFRHNRLHKVAAMLLIVGSKVLDRPGHAPTVQPAQLGAGHLSGQKRILGEILEIAAVQRVAMDIDTGAQQRINMVFAQLQPFHRVEFLTQFLVERRSQTGAIGHGEGYRAAIHTDTAGAVGTAGRRQTVVLQSIADTADGPRRTRRDARGVHPLTPNDRAKLVVAELRDKISHVRRAVGYILQADALVPGLGVLLRQTGRAAGLGQFGLGGNRLPCGGTVRTGAQPLKSRGGCSGGFQLLHHHQRQRDRKGRRSIAHIGTETENIVTGFQHKG